MTMHTPTEQTSVAARFGDEMTQPDHRDEEPHNYVARQPAEYSDHPGMKKRRKRKISGRGIAATIGVVFLLALVIGNVERALGLGTSNSDTPAAAVPTTVEPLPDGWKRWAGNNDAVVWKWEKNIACKAYQDGCWGVAVLAIGDCPGGVYIDVAAVDRDGTIMDDGNAITAPLSGGDNAKVAVSPPSGVPGNVTGRLTKLECLG